MATKEKFDIYKDVTRMIVMRLSEGDIPWRKRWCSPVKGKMNYVSRRSYNGINLLLLDKEGEYLTYNQCTKAGGKVIKGEHARKIYIYFPYVPDKYKEEYKRRKAAGEDTDELTVPVLRYENVFHLSQTEGLKTKIETAEHHKAQEPVDIADFVIEKYGDKTGIRIRETGTDSISVGKDGIVIPSRTQFAAEEQWYNTAFAEMVRASLRTVLKDKTLTDVQADLVSEIAACMVTTGCGLSVEQTRQDTLAECSRWMKEFNRDYRLVVTAAAQAQKVAEYILEPIL